ncbi:hypothetical protein [Halobaculum gomorrense]|uniref:Uncharacterized protein n=1 Tax=Halobaculum gomorrense TaxID=43928 RepID=A0A1M5S0X6_9EURY|nr:hypothetical protein [Halobaculum gomorrense]SHH31978.1 hypothetical protein SAMN05443636_2297 [Halobaculum gomorrense]
MADLNPAPDDRGDGSGRGDRGQLVLITGLALAVVLVALVLVTNTAIFTDNLATRDRGVGDTEALGYRATVIDGVGGIVERENAAEYADRDELTANVTAGVVRFDDAIGRTAAIRATSARVNRSSLSYVDGVLVRHRNESSGFVSAAESADWTVATDVNRTRAFAATVDRSSLARTEAATLDDAFAVVVEGNASSDEWTAYVYENATTGHIAVAVSPVGAAGATEVCSVDASSATVGFTTGTLAGEACAGLDWRGGVDDAYDLRFRNGTSAAGTYDLTVRGGVGAVNDAAIADGTASDDPESPYFVPAVYAVEATIRYETSELEYETDIRVAPGESDA